MVRRGETIQPEVREQMRGGKGSVLVTQLEKERLPEHGRLFAKLTIRPGCSIGEHVHDGEAEMFYFMQGEGVVTDDGVEVPVRAGDVMTTESGHSHSVENTGAVDMEIIATIIKE